MERKSTPWPTWLGSILSGKPCQSQKAGTDQAPEPETDQPATPALPVGYIINKRSGPAGDRGTGYDYLLSREGLLVEAESALLRARSPVLAGPVKGLASAGPYLELPNGPIPGNIVHMGIAWLRESRGTERFFAICWDCTAYRPVVPDQEGATASLTYDPNIKNVVAEFHSHGYLRAFFSKTDDRDEQGFRIYGVVGRLDQPKPEAKLRLGIYGNFTAITWEDAFSGPPPNVEFLA